MLALKASEQRYRELFQNVTAGVFQTTADGKFMAANPALVRMLGYDSEDELLELDVARDIYMDPDHRDNWTKAMQETGEVRNAELVLKRKDGSKIVVLENSRAVRDADGRVLFYEGTLTDITAAHELSQQLSYEASHDALTGLCEPPRIRAAAAARARDVAGDRGGARDALPRPRPLQDGERHLRPRRRRRTAAPARRSAAAAGAHERRRRAARRRRIRRAAAQLPPEDAQQVANNLLKTVDEFEFIWGTNKFTLGVSIGLVAIDSHFKRLTQVMNAADSACYAAKDAGRHRVAVYQEDALLLERRHGEMEWVARAKRALVENRLFLEAQEIRPLGQPAGGAPRLPHYELLLRMRDESGRVVPPGAFLPAVERYNLSVRYDRWVIATAIEWVRAHADAFKRDLARSSSTSRATAWPIPKRPSSSARAWRRAAWIRGASASRPPRASRSATWARPMR